MLGMVLASCGTVPSPGTVTDAAGIGADLRPAFERFGLAPKNQSPRGCCSLFALVGALEYEWACARQQAPAVRLSEEYLNWASHQTNGRRSDGSFFADALRGLATFGICREDLMPYAREFDPDAEPSPEAHADAAERRDVRALWIKAWDVTTGMTDEMLAAIRREIAQGHPVAIGMRWPRAESYTPEGLLTVPPRDQVFDGHSVLLVGWRDDPSAPGGGWFLFRNSFGPGWREGGHGRMPFAYAMAYGNDAVSLRLGGGVLLPCNRGARSPIEFETLGTVQADGCEAVVQRMAPWGAARWSGGAQLFCRSSPGAVLTAVLPELPPGAYRAGLFATRAPDYGVVAVSLDDRLLAGDLDLYGAEVAPTGRLDLGTVTLTPGPHRLRVEVRGRNAASRGAFLGLDCLEFVPTDGAP